MGNQKPSSSVEQTVTYEQIAKFADHILAEGELPSILRIRGMLSSSTVSTAEISDHLEHWKKKQLAIADDNPIRTQLLAAIQVEQDIFKRTSNLEHSLALVRSTLEATTDGILVVDKNGRFVDYNQRFMQMWNVDVEALQSGDEQKGLQSVLHQLVDPDEFYRIVSKVYSDLEASEINEVRLKDGRIFEMYSQPYRVHGHVVGRVWSNRDVTQQKALQELKEKTAAEKALTKKAIQVAHDLNSPVAAILMLARSCATLPEEERIALREAAHRIQEIANNLMAQYRGESESRDSAIKPCLILALVLSIVAEKSIQYKNFPIKILSDIKSQASMAVVLINAVEFKRAISNLINNAVEAIQKNGLIKISMTQESGQVIISLV